MLDVNRIRSHFPSLSRQHNGKPLVYFDGPGGTQVPTECIDAMVNYYQRHNANTHGNFITSQESDAVIAAAHEYMADFLNAKSANEIVFGQNMTSLTFAISRSIGQTLHSGDEIILTLLDHAGNFSPWHLMAQDRGVKVNVIDINPEDCTLRMDDFEKYLSNRTKLIAVGCCSNAVGTFNPVKQIVGMAKAVGALTYLDAVAFAPHAPIDVQDLDCDFLACSAYKFFGPHQGIMYGKYDLLDRLPAYKVRPADARPPYKFETGTQSIESEAGTMGALDYIAWIGKTYPPAKAPSGTFRSARAATLHAGMTATQDYEAELSKFMLDGLLARTDIDFYGIREKERVHQRAPTFAIRKHGETPEATATRLGEQGICVWNGNYYALNLTERLGVEESGGMVRIGFAHYNTKEEIQRFLDVL